MIKIVKNLLLLLAAAAAACVQSSLAFSVEPTKMHRSMTWQSSPRVIRSTTSTTRTSSALLVDTNNNNSNNNDADDDDNDNADDEAAVPSPPPVTPSSMRQPPSPSSKKPLDPLVASLTRIDPGTAATNSNTKTAMVPFFGELPVDGSLLVLIPAAVIGVVGFVMSIVVAFNAKDTFVDQLSQFSDEINAAALAKTNYNANAVEDSCRGLCSSQEEQLESMRIIMQGLSKK